MEIRTEMGKNRTGLQMSPAYAKKMEQVTKMTTPSSSGDGSAMEKIRADYISDSGPLGTVPMPSTLKGAAKAGAQALTGDRAQVFLDRLGERLAFERSGTRLYQAFLQKCRAAPEGAGPIDIGKVEHFCGEEAHHFAMLAKCFENLGADPTAQTPGADVAGMEGAGLLQVVTDPRTNVNQSLHAILVAELADYDGWNGLIQLAQQMGMDEMTQQFQKALKEENEHLETVRRWHQQATLTEAKLVKA